MVRNEQRAGFAWMNPVCSVEISWLLISGSYARHVDQRHAGCICRLPAPYAHELAHLFRGHPKFLETRAPDLMSPGTVQKRKDVMAPGQLAHRRNGAHMRRRIRCSEVAHVLHDDQIKDAR